VLVQPFIDSVLDEGEVSPLFSTESILILCESERAGATIKCKIIKAAQLSLTRQPAQNRK
jgi:hypothetical protein